MKGTRLAAAVATAITLAAALATPALADPDIDFNQELHKYDIYGARDYNAYIGKITCKRLYKGVDANKADSAAFLITNLPRGSTQQQAYEFLGLAIKQYCPEQTPVLQDAPPVRA